MKFKKVLDGLNVQGYSVSKPSKAYKKLFPQKYVFSLDVFGEHVLFNSNEIPRNFTVYPPVGYIFTTDKTLPKFLINDRIQYKDVGGSFASCLDHYFSGTEDKIDLILSISPKNNEVPPRFVNEIVVQCNSDQLMKSNRLKENVMSIVNGYLKEGTFNVETWMRKVLFDYPINNNGLPVRYPKVINDKNVNNCSVSVNDIFVEYDFRAKSYEKEDALIVGLEDAFENLNEEVIIHENYNHLLSKLKKALDSKKLKYKELTPDSIKVKAKFLREVNLKYQLTDFI